MRKDSLVRRRHTQKFAVLLGAAALAATGCSASGDLVAYDLPAERARYTLAADSDGAHTTWEYTSSQPTQDEAPELNPCVSTADEAPACRPEPLIFLKYDLGLEVDNTLPVRGAHSVTITGYYQDLDSPPQVTDLRLEVTVDDGQTWQDVRTRPQGDGMFTASIRHPKVAESGEVVGLRVNATDSQGNTVEQTIPHAYRLS